MNKFLVIGNPIDHSLSPELHNFWINKFKINATYSKLQIDENQLEDIITQIRNGELKGINITVPFKEKILNLVDKLTPEAEHAKSVNTVYKEGKKVIGHNTDIAGFELSIRHHKVDVKNKKILILGSGGVVPSIIIALQKLNVAKIYMMNRTREKAEKLSKRFKNLTVLNWGEKCDFELIINATSVGINKNEDLKLEFNHLPPNRIFYDVIYNPEETLFLKNAKANLHRIINGKMMFIYQAHQSFTIWHKVMPKIDEDTINKIKI